MEPRRVEYEIAGMRAIDLNRDPFRQFARWFDAAVAAELPEANMMSLATVSEAGDPDARIVLLKSHGPDGFVFFTNYGSTKGRQLDNHPVATLVFHWQPLHRQIRISGTVSKVSEDESDEYFAIRPRGAQLAARTSAQSSVVASRDDLERAYALELAHWQGQAVPRPEGWGGYLVAATRFEFWQGRVNRLHDRFVYEPSGDQWSLQRLSP